MCVIKAMRSIALLLVLGGLCGCIRQPSPGSPLSSPAIPPAECLAVEPLCQHPEFPTGCEAITAVMALHYVGESIEPEAFIDLYLPTSMDFYRNGLDLCGPDPRQVFVGDPHTTASYGCFSPVIEQALISYFGFDDRVCHVSGAPLPELCSQYIDNGLPVILWATIDMKPSKRGQKWRLSDGSYFTWPSGEHCLLLVGYNSDHYLFCDPKYGEIISYECTTVEARYEELGRQALVVLPAD